MAKDIKFVKNAFSNTDTNNNEIIIRKLLSDKIDGFIEGIEMANGIVEFEAGTAAFGALRAIPFLKKLKRCLADAYVPAIFCVESRQRDHLNAARKIERLAMSEEDISDLTEFIF